MRLATRWRVTARGDNGLVAERVAALYVDANGVYANLEGVDVWDEARLLALLREHGRVP